MYLPIVLYSARRTRVINIKIFLYESENKSRKKKTTMQTKVVDGKFR